MTRFVSLLLVGLSLVAVTLAQPAQAQQGQWYRGLPYFLSSNTQRSETCTTVTATINGGDTGHVAITSLPTPTDPGYTTSGSYTGSVGVYYVWSGGNPTKAMVLSTTQTQEATGNIARGSGSSNAGTQSGSTANSPAWDQRGPAYFINQFAADVSPASVNQVTTLGGNTWANYPNTATITADVTFGPPVMTQSQ